MSFKTLNIIEPILKALADEGYTIPTPIQQQAIPPLLENKDLLGCAQTGTGKTAAFAIPILQGLYNQPVTNNNKRIIKALIITPTRELATQIGNSFSTYGANLGYENTVIFGGVSQYLQVKIFEKGVDILIATPGRLIDLINQKVVDLSNVSYFVLDEADHMLDMGFINDVKKIIRALPSKRQTMLFSATMPTEIEELANSILNNPVKVAVAPISSTVDSIKQSVYYVNKNNKTNLLIHLLQDKEIKSALVFSRTKYGADRIAKNLVKAGITCDVIHADKGQQARQFALERFKNLESRVLVATDIVARGIDIDELSHVINYDLPQIPESYVHRIGRTGRAGLSGTAISFCDEIEIKLLKDIEKLINKKIPVVKEHPYPLVRSEESQVEEKIDEYITSKSSSNKKNAPNKTMPKNNPASKSSSKGTSNNSSSKNNSYSKNTSNKDSAKKNNNKPASKGDEIIGAKKYFNKLKSKVKTINKFK